MENPLIVRDSILIAIAPGLRARNLRAGFGLTITEALWKRKNRPGRGHVGDPNPGVTDRP